METRLIMKWVSKFLVKWENLLRKIEGPELEPSIWHSHYLTGRFSRRCLPRLGRKLKGKILDIGAGTGHGARYLNKEKTRYYPTDLPTMTNRLTKKISRHTENIKIYCSGYALPLIDNCMEGVMLISVLEHLENPRLALSEAHRVLITGGRLLLVAPFAFPVHGFPLDYKRWTLEGLKLETKNAGFKIIDEVSFGNTFTSLALNLNLLLKYNLHQSDYRLLSLILVLITPITLLNQLICNLLALLLGPLDRSNAFPLGIAILGEKVKKIE